MDLSNAFSSIGSFWSAVAALVCIHLLLIGALIVVGFRPQIRARTARFRDWVKDEPGVAQFGLTTKLPVLAVIAVLFYFTIFNWMVRLTGAIAATAGLDLDFNEISLWQDLHPQSALAELSRASGDPAAGLSDLEGLKFRLLDQFKGRDPDQYRAYVGWIDGPYQSTVFIFHAEILLVVALAVAAIWIAWRRLRRRGNARYARAAGLAVLAALTAFVLIPPTLLRAEGLLAARAGGELFFVGDELRYQRTHSAGRSAATTSVDAGLSTEERVEALLSCSPHQPYASAFTIPGERWLKRVLLAHNDLPIHPRADAQPIAPYVTTVPRRPPGEDRPADKLCLYLLTKGIGVVEANSETVAAKRVHGTVSVPPRALVEAVRMWLRLNPDHSAYVCRRLPRRHPICDSSNSRPLTPT